VKALAGDLELPLFGLSLEHWQELANQCSVIFHAGAQVNWLVDYSLARAANVLGTQTALALAAAADAPLHFVSTLSVVEPASAGSSSETTPLQPAQLWALLAQPGHGYAASKWVGDFYMQRAREQKWGPVFVYRPGFISGHSTSGACNPTDYLSRMLRACLMLGALPASEVQRIYVCLQCLLFIVPLFIIV
jgi:thioester reductase-like protein